MGIVGKSLLFKVLCRGNPYNFRDCCRGKPKAFVELTI